MKYETDKHAPLHVAPHYTEMQFKKAQTVYCSEPDSLAIGDFGSPYVEGCHYDYSDRLWQRDHDKAVVAAKSANDAGYTRQTAAWYEVFLNHFYEKPVTLVHILAGFNVGNGYPYQVFGTRKK